jgi:hypothetical protein
MMALPDESLPDKVAVAHTRAWAIVRLVFGTLQTVGASAGFVLLVGTGLSKETVWVIGVTLGITLLSRFAFRRADRL